MSDPEDRKAAQKTALKRLRSERADHIERVRKSQNVIRETRRALKKALEDGPRTVPDLAGATGRTTDDVLWHVAAMRAYGIVTEDEQEESYFKYRLVPAKKKGR